MKARIYLFFILIFTIFLFFLIKIRNFYKCEPKAIATQISRYQQLVNRNAGFEERARANGIPNVEKVEISRPANKDSISKLKPIEKMKGYKEERDLENNATYKIRELLTYEEFINRYEADLNLSISKDRMIWVTVTHYPNGFQHRRGFVKNAILIKYYDAETGELYGYGLRSLDKEGNGIIMK